MFIVLEIYTFFHGDVNFYFNKKNHIIVINLDLLKIVLWSLHACVWLEEFMYIYHKYWIIFVKFFEKKEKSGESKSSLFKKKSDVFLKYYIYLKIYLIYR